MAAFRSASFCLIICFLICSSEAQEITAELGQDVILPCRDPNITNIKNIRAVEWSRPGRKTEYVLVYRDGHVDPYNQHPSYQDRVDLQDKEMKDGDVSLILTNVMKSDTGIYECWVFQGGTNRRKRSGPEPISIITLEVGPSGEKFEGNTIGEDISRGHLGVVGGILPPLVVLAYLGSLIYKRPMKKNPNLSVPPDEAAAIEMLPVPEQHQNQVQLV